MACCDALATIQNACEAARKTAKGMLGKLYIACINDVSAVPAASSHAIGGDITMETDKLFYEINFDKVGSSYKAEPQGEGQSKYYRVTLTAFIPGIAAAVKNILSPTIRGEFMLIAPDKNGIKHLIGGLDDGAEVAITEQTDDRNGYLVVASWDTPELPYVYNGAIPLV